MNRFKRMLSAVLVLIMVFSLVACGGGQDTTGSTAPSDTNGNNANGKKTYTVNVKTNGGMAMEGVNVFVYGDEALTDMKAAGGTNAQGQASFELADGTYYVQLQGVANGFDVQPSYRFNGTTADITLTSSLVDEDVAGHTFKVGDVMYDFSFEDNSRIICDSCEAVNDTSEKLVSTADDGTEVTTLITRTKCAECEADLNWENPTFNTITLSEVLAEKELVVLNFWYTTCSNCVVEFPILNEAYNMMSDKVGVLGLNSYAPDTLGGVMTFESSYQLDLDFPLGKVSNEFAPKYFINPLTGDGAEGYPTSVFVDRYGVICAIEVGSMTSLTQWVSVMSHFTGDDYQQKLVTSLDELIERVIPNFEQPSAEEIAAAIKVGDYNVNFHGEEGDIFSWPFVVTEKDGRTCMKASNQKMYESYAILYAEIELEAGDVVGFDYLASCEVGGDALHVIVNGEAIYTIAALSDEWKSAYCWVAQEAGTYEVALCYIKDTDVDRGDDTVYIDNLRVVTEAEIDTPSYIPHLPALEQPDGSFKYEEIFFNEADGYYHVGSVDGPLLLANLMGYTQMFEDNFVYMICMESGFVLNGVDYLPQLTPFCTVASNSSLYGYCTVTWELAELLKKFTQLYGFEGSENEWLQLCKYYNAYGTDGKQLQDPNAGLAWFSAYEAVLGNGYVDENGEGQNFFYYDGRPIMPRGLWARFTPEKSGAYRITSHTDYTEGLNAWIFDKNGNILYEHTGGEMAHGMYADPGNITMVFYMEAGKDYYIDIAMYDVYGMGYVLYDIEYLGDSYEVFTACSPGPFTYEEGSGQISIRGIDVAIAEDGYYHEVLERDANGNPVRFGSIVYAYFTGPTTLFSQSILEMIAMDGFDFSKTDYDLEIIAYLNQHNGDVEATDAFLHELWGADYDTYAELYQVEDVYAGIYHGTGPNLAAELEAYAEKMVNSTPGDPLNGCVAVDARLAELLTMLMDKYTFQDVDYSWQKLCYYYDIMGPEA